MRRQDQNRSLISFLSPFQPHNTWSPVNSHCQRYCTNPSSVIAPITCGVLMGMSLLIRKAREAGSQLEMMPWAFHHHRTRLGTLSFPSNWGQHLADLSSQSARDPYSILTSVSVCVEVARSPCDREIPVGAPVSCHIPNDVGVCWSTGPL